MLNRWKIHLASVACFVASLAYGQNANTLTLTGNGNPVGTCAFIMRYVDALNGNEWSCNQATNSWVKVGPGAGGAGITQIDPGANVGPTVTFSVGSAGTDFAISNPGANQIQLDLPVATALNTGKLSNTDWGTFNSKQPALSTHGAVAKNYLTGFTAPNTFTAAQPSCSDLSDAGTGCSGAAYPGLVAHDILSVTHGDTTAAAVVRGDLMTGQGVAPKWARLPKGGVGECLQMDGTATDIIWGACSAGGFPRLDQVLDPTADKTFDMGVNILRFTGLDASGAIFNVNTLCTIGGCPSSVNLGVTSSGAFGGNVIGIVGYGEYASDVDNSANYSGAARFQVGQVGIGKTKLAALQILAGYSDSPLLVPENVGIFVDNQTAGATNYAIKTGLGQNSFGDITHGTRFSVSNGTALVSGDFALSASWGNTASIGSIRGTDQSFSFTVTSAGTGQADSPTATLTFKDGTWTTVPVFVCKQVGGTGIFSDIKQTESATSIILTWLATPTAAATYSFNCVGMGI